MSQLRRVLGLRDLVLFNIAAVIGIRWLAAAAQAGSGSVTLWLLAAVLFFVPSGLAVARLSLRFPEEGGIYVWTKRGFGEWHGFLCGWCYWLSNLFYFPNLLVAGVGMAGYALGLAENKTYIIGVSLAILWVALATNILGLSLAKWTSAAGGMATYLAGALIIVFGAAAWWRAGSATPLQVLPHWDFGKLNFWSQIAFAFGGLELGAIMGGEIRDPARNVPRAAWISGFAIAAFYILGTLAMLALLPPERISIISGLVQAGEAAGLRLGSASGWPGRSSRWCWPASPGNWWRGWRAARACRSSSASTATCPPAFARLHPRWGTPHVSLLAQGAVCTVFLLALQAGETLRTAYQLLVDMTVITYFIPFLYLFAASWKYGRAVERRLGPGRHRAGHRALRHPARRAAARPGCSRRNSPAAARC